MPPPERRGLSLLETLFAIVLTTVCLGGLLQAMSRGVALVRECTIVGDVDARAGRALHSIVRELLPSDSGTFVPDLEPPLVGPNPGYSAVAFRTAESYQAGAVVWSAPTRLQWQLAPGELDNGLDDDGDGVVDDGSIVLVRNAGQADERSAAIVGGVREYLEGEVPNGVDDNGNGLVDERGFCLLLEGDVLTIRLSLQRTGPDGRAVVRTHETSITTRNP